MCMMHLCVVYALPHSKPLQAEETCAVEAMSGADQRRPYQRIDSKVTVNATFAVEAAWNTQKCDDI